MDTESIITLVIVVVSIIWSLSSKARKKSDGLINLPFFGQMKEKLQAYPEDLGSYALPEGDAGDGREAAVMNGEVLQEDAGEAQFLFKSKTSHLPPEPGPETVINRPDPKSKLREAVIWAEILEPPLAIKPEKQWWQ